LEAQLGASWPTLLVGKHPDRSAGDFAWMAGHVVAFTNVLELALRLDLLGQVAGIAKVRRAIARDPRPDVLAHSRLQLEVAALAERAGATPILEPRTRGVPPADVAFTLNGSRLVIETRAVFTSDEWRAANRRTEYVFEQIRDVELKHGVQCEGHLSRQLDDDERVELLALLEERARLVAAGAISPALQFAGARLLVSKRGDSPGRGLSGPELRGDMWSRITRRIVDKAAQAKQSGANWLRLDAANGLWQFTTWSVQPLARKLDGLLPLAVPALGSLDGIVISSGALQRQGQFQDEELQLGNGLSAARRLISPHRIRETLVIPSTAEHAAAAQSWQAMYVAEPNWLSWALARAGLPPADAIFSR
jgi:hypothetical protein